MTAPIPCEARKFLSVAETKSGVSALALKAAKLLPFELAMLDLVKSNRVFDRDQADDDGE